MSYRRLTGTLVGLVIAAAVLAQLTPDLPGGISSGALQEFADRAGPENLVLAGIAVLAWLAWAWGAAGLLLTALSAAPGMWGALGRAGASLLLPANARRSAALALGIGLAVSSPALTACTPSLPAAVDTPTHTAELVPAAGAVPDWPGAAAAVPDWPGADAAVPDWPSAAVPDDPVPDWPAPATGEHVVLRGDSLWEIAATDLLARTGAEPEDAEVAAAVQRWWSANAAVIGPDPDLLLPGQVLVTPVLPDVPGAGR